MQKRCLYSTDVKLEGQSQEEQNNVSKREQKKTAAPLLVFRIPALKHTMPIIVQALCARGKC